MNTITFYSEDNDHDEVNFNGETLTLILQVVKFYFYAHFIELSKYKTNSYCLRARHRSATTNIYGDIISEGSKVIIGHCSIWWGKNLWLLIC